MSTESKFYDLSEDTLSQVNAIIGQMALPFNIKIKFLGNNKMKKLISLKKASDELVHISAIDLILFINEDYLLKLEGPNAEILMTQELDRLHFDIATGKFKIAKFPLQTTAGVLKKYGIEAVAEANELSELFTKQSKDGKESEFDVNSAEVKAKVKRKKDVEFLN
jgi:hypothetical protein